MHNDRWIALLQMVLALGCAAGVCSAAGQDVVDEDAVHQDVVAWCEGFGLVPARDQLDTLIQFDRGYVADPNHAAWLGVLYSRGVPGYFGVDRERSRELMAYAAGHGQPLALLWQLNQAIQSRSREVVRRVLAEDLNGAPEIMADRLRAVALVAGAHGLTDRDPAEAIQSLVRWHDETSNEAAGQALYAIKDLISAELTVDIDLILETHAGSAWTLVARAEQLHQVALRDRTSESRAASRAAWEHAAEQGHGFAMIRLGIGMWEGSLVFERDRTAAIFWISQAAYLDERLAMLLAHAWIRGEGCDPKHDAAIALLERLGKNVQGGIWTGADADAIENIVSPHE